MLQFFLWITYIRTFSHRKLYMKNCYSSRSLWILKFLPVLFFSQKCPNTPQVGKMLQYSQFVYYCCDEHNFPIWKLFSENKMKYGFFFFFSVFLISSDYLFLPCYWIFQFPLFQNEKNRIWFETLIHMPLNLTNHI